MPVPSKPQKPEGFHLRTEKDPEVTCFSHISRTVVMKPKILLITPGFVPVSATGVKKKPRTAILVICTNISTNALTPTVFLFLTLAKCLEDAGYVPRGADAFGNAPSQREAHFRGGRGETKLPWGE